MEETTGNLWDRYDQLKAHEWVLITTNGFIKRTGECVMGRGVARDAALRFPTLPAMLGTRIRERGNVVQFFPEQRLITFPVKHNWYEPANLDLIRVSSRALRDEISKAAFIRTAFNTAHSGLDLPGIERIYMPRPGCGNGKLLWRDVKPVLDEEFGESAKYLTVVDLGAA
jgi:hypothetical protein